MRSRRTLKDSLQERRRNLFNWNSTGILGPRPSLVLNFIEGFALDPRITFARADATTCATRYNSSGLLETVAANVPRFDYDPVTLAAKGLLIEESRANIALQSNAFTTGTWPVVGTNVYADSAVTGIDGAISAATVTESTATEARYKYQVLTGLTANGTYTLTLYVKKISGAQGIGIAFGSNTTTASLAVANRGYARWDTLSSGAATTSAINGTGLVVSTNSFPAPNGFTRLVMSFTFDSGNTSTSFAIGFYVGTGGAASSVLGDGSVYAVTGAQLEAGTFPTSYIPTAASAVTRAADSALVTGTNFSDWYNQTEGTFVCGAVNQFVTGAVGKTWLHVSTATLNDRYTGQVSTVGKPQLFVVSGGTTQVNGIGATLATLVANTPFKTAFGYKVNDFAIAVDGQTAVTDTLGALPVAVDRMRIGGISTTNTPFNGHIRSVSYYNTRLTNAELQRLSV